MPHYRFRWESLAPSVLRRLRTDLDLGQGNAAQRLRKTFGPRPDADFVRVAWPSLLNGWLTRDRAALRSVVAALRARRLGSHHLPVHTAAAEVEYLRSCRNSAALREVVLEHLLAIGECTAADRAARERPAGQPGPIAGKKRAASAAAASSPEDLTRDQLRAMVDGALTQCITEDVIKHDDDGDVPIRYGSTMVFVRVAEDAAVVQVFAPVIWEVPYSPALLEAVNDLNSGIRFARVKFEPGGGVTVAAEVPGVPFSAPHVVHAVEAVGSLADGQTEPFQERFGGRVFFGDAVPAKQEVGSGGYL